MPIKSMTGFGKSEISKNGYSIRTELKSVNNRFFEIQFRSTRFGVELEQKLRSLASDFFSRGSFTCTMDFEIQSNEVDTVQINKPLLEGYVKALEMIQKKLPQFSQIDLGNLLRLPDLVKVDSTPLIDEEISRHILQSFKQACLQLNEMREKEGENLKQDLEQRLHSIANLLEEIESKLPLRQKEFQIKLQQKIQEILGDAKMDDSRVLTEVGILAERLDVSEEIIRIKSHLQLFRDTIFTPPHSGKRLGFLQQEMLREVNTMGSKAQYSEIVHRCVSMKEDLEKIREQIQNIE